MNKLIPLVIFCAQAYASEQPDDGSIFYFQMPRLDTEIEVTIRRHAETLNYQFRQRCIKVARCKEELHQLDLVISAFAYIAKKDEFYTYEIAPIEACQQARCTDGPDGAVYMDLDTVSEEMIISFLTELNTPDNPPQ